MHKSVGRNPLYHLKVRQHWTVFLTALNPAMLKIEVRIFFGVFIHFKYCALYPNLELIRPTKGGPWSNLYEC